jgi:DNA-binding IclR family transcriptional regulator
MARDLSRSIKRTLEVLEYFNPEHPTVSVNEISKALGYPQSSTSILLKSLSELGYLNYDKKTRTYRPSPRVALLGRGLRPYLFGDGRVMAALEEVARSTGELTFLAAPAGAFAQYIHVIPATNPVRLHMHTGAVRPMIGSGAGHLFLSALPDSELNSEIERFSERIEKPTISRDQLMREIRRIRRNGYVLTTSTVTPGGGMLATLMPGLYGGSSLAVGVGGVAGIITANEEKYLAILRSAIQRHLAPLHSHSEMVMPAGETDMPQRPPRAKRKSKSQPA